MKRLDHAAVVLRLCSSRCSYCACQSEIRPSSVRSSVQGTVLAIGDGSTLGLRGYIGVLARAYRSAIKCL